MAEYEKLDNNVLLISGSIPAYTMGTLKSIYCLFNGIDPKNYFILTSSVYKNILGTESLLPKKYYYFDAWSRASDSKLNKFFIYRLCSKLRNIIGELFGGVKLLTIGFWLIKSNRIKKIIIVADTRLTVFFSYLLAIISNTPYGLIFFDLYDGNFFINNVFAYVARTIEPRLLKNSEFNIVTNNGTKEYFLNKYSWLDSCSIKVIYNSIYPVRYKDSIKNNADKWKNVYSMVYTGAIYWAQEQSIENAIQAILSINDIDIKFYIYTLNLDNNLVLRYKDNQKVIFSKATPDEIPDIQAKADILFLPLSWDSPSMDIIKTATPGKLSDYLLSGKPILIHAPDYSFLAKYIKEKDCGCVVDINDISKLALSIKNLINNEEYKKKIIKNAEKLFYLNHNAQNNSTLLANIINSNQ